MSEAKFVPLVDTASGTSDGFRNWAEPVAGASASPADPYALGLAEGQLLAEAAFAEERRRLLVLVAAANALQPIEPEAVRTLICEAVNRLVREIVGATPVDADHLHRQVEEASELAGTTGTARVLRLSPQDVALLEGAGIKLPIVPDAALTPGTLRVETDGCTVEHGRDVQLEALSLQLGLAEERP